ncbi:hypothetical protein ACFOY8_07945 [Thalassospira xianhensis]|uniref:hypothetical protein n=1 Tax=Thalassospira xianhensis TaxID=478503 RepID=UPI00142D5DA6|nr:hypothetical protein [Thalassospira xianhensis]
MTFASTRHARERGHPDLAATRSVHQEKRNFINSNPAANRLRGEGRVHHDD